jgi:DNA polymerase-3 subunit gamma/tau
MSAAGVLSGLVRELAWQSTLVAIEQGHPTVWRLRVGHESLRGQALRSKLAEALGSIVGESLQVEVDAGDPHDTPLQRDTAERALRQQEAERDIREDPLVKDLLDRFASARIVPGSIRPL